MSSTALGGDISEVRDIHPIFRANPFLVEEGAMFSRGERFLSNSSLRHIDLELVDARGMPMFTEIKWSTIDEDQVTMYHRDISSHVKTFRLIWVIPDDLSQAIPDLKRRGAEVKTFRRERILKMVEVRRVASACLLEIKKMLEQPFNVLIYHENVEFENPIRACYFEGRATTDRGTKKVGLKQSGIGRYLDLVQSICVSPVAKELPELTLNLVWELLVLPYSYKVTRHWIIVKEGFGRAHRGHLPKSLASVISSVWNAVDGFHSQHNQTIRELYENNVKKYDLLCRVINEAVSSFPDPTTVGIKDLVESLIDRFALSPTAPKPRISHHTLNQWIENIVTTDGYENDFAKRIIEMAVLRRILIPVGGVPVMWVLAPRYREGQFETDRTPCQSLTYNRDSTLYLDQIEVAE